MVNSLNVEGGSIIPYEPIRLMTGNGFIDDFRYRATCHVSGQTFECIGADCARWWLSIRHAHYEWVERRKGMIEANLITA